MERLIGFRRKMNSVTDKSLSESDIHNSGNVQAGFGNGVMEVGNKI